MLTCGGASMLTPKTCIKGISDISLWRFDNCERAW
jgi:hypothetical protein